MIKKYSHNVHDARAYITQITSNKKNSLNLNGKIISWIFIIMWKLKRQECRKEGSPCKTAHFESFQAVNIKSLW